MHKETTAYTSPDRTEDHRFFLIHGLQGQIVDGGTGDLIYSVFRTEKSGGPLTHQAC